MVIVTSNTIEELKLRVRQETTFVYVVPVDTSIHPVRTSPSVTFVGFTDGSVYCVAQRHPDALETFTLDFSDAKTLMVPDKKTFLHLYPSVDPRVVMDTYGIVYLATGTVSHEIHKTAPFVQNLTTKFKFKNLTLSVPLTVLCKEGEESILWIRDAMKFPVYAGDAYSFLNDIAIPTLTSVEASGIWTATGTPEYSKYNLYTSTGRPSNAFGGVNYAALNKHDGSRDKYVSRFGENGTLVQFDYEAFHLRLLANSIGYQLPTTSVHRYLAEQYYGKTDITPEEYDASKARTFALMYGHGEDTDKIEFFTKVRERIRSFKGDRFTSELGRTVIVPDPNPAKLFNYYMQLSETEFALSRVYEVLTFLRDRRSKVVLYTYDAILMDFHNEELDLTTQVQSILERETFPTRQYRGPNYGNLHEISVP